MALPNESILKMENTVKLLVYEILKTAKSIATLCKSR